MLQAANDRFLFDLVARKPVETLKQEHFDAASEDVCNQLAATGATTNARGPRDAVIRVHRDNFKLLTLGARPAHPGLILDRRFPLFVGRIPGVDDRRG